MSRARRIIVLLVVCAAAGAAAPVVRADFWYEHYDKAEDALEREDWLKAIEELNSALGKKDTSQLNARTYGVNMVSYLPYYKLGLAYYGLNQFDAALQAFDTEVQLNKIQGSKDNYDDLRRLQGLIAATQEEEREREAQRIRELVAQGVSSAERLEAEGDLEGAIEAVNQALAVDQSDARSSEILSRLRNAIAQRDQQLRLETRVAELTDQGRGLVAQGNYQEAASVFSQAQSILPSDELGQLLADAQSKLRAEIQAREGEARSAQMVADGLTEAEQLVNAGNAEKALQALQTVLALEPDNPRVVDLQRRIAEQQAVVEAQRVIEDRGNAVDGLLAQARLDMESFRVRQAIGVLNKAIAIDPANQQARDALTRAYGALRTALLGDAPEIRWPPGQELQVGDLIVKAAQNASFELIGQVFDESLADSVAVRLVHYPCTGFFRCLLPSAGLEHSVEAFSRMRARDGAETVPEVVSAETEGGPVAVGEAALKGEPLGALILTNFEIEVPLSTGLSVFSVTATDLSGQTGQSEYAVWYAVPFYQTTWFYGFVAGLVAAVAGGVYLQRARRRKKLLERRFNPYVAGAPILQDEGYYGRDRLMHRVMQSIHNNSILLYGERRIGKTSFQHRLGKRLKTVDDPEFEFYPVYIDLQGTPEERFFSTLGEEVFEELAPILDGVKPNEKLHEPETYTHRELTRDLREVLKVLRAKSKKTPKLVLQIDEVDELNSYDPRINQRLRSLFMKSFADNLAAVVSGVSIKKHWESEGSPWYNFFEEVPVEPFQRKDAEELIRVPIRGIFKIDDDAVEKILDVTECKPYLIQKLCVSLVNHMHDDKRTTVTAADVDVIGRPRIEPFMEK